MTGVSTALGWSLLHFLWQGAAIGGAGALALRLLRSSTPSIRYLFACGTLALMLAAPVVTALTSNGLPAIIVPSVSGPAAPGSSRSSDPGSAVVAAPGRLHDAAMRRQSPEHSPLLTLLVVLWASGVAVMSLRLAGGWCRVHRMHRRALSAPPSSWDTASRRLASRLGLRRPVTVVDWDEQTIPMLVGWMRPVIILPAACLAGLSPRQVEAILAHELAHVRRHDLLVSLLQSIAETLLFYHPAIWWMSARIREEREYCCDDAAVQACGDPVAYVDALVRLEASRATSRVFVAAATDGSLVARARRLLGRDDIPRRRCAGSVPVLLLFIVTAGVLARAVGVGSLPIAPPPEPGSAAGTPIAITAPAIGDLLSPVAAREAAPLVRPANAHLPAVPAEPARATGVARPGMPAASSGGVPGAITGGVPGGVMGGVPGGVPGSVAGVVSGAQSAAAPAENARMLALLFDLTSLGPDDLNTSRLVALQFVDTRMADGDLMAVVSVSAGVDVVADFTSDRDTLRTALQSLEPAIVPFPESRTDAPAPRWVAPLRTVCETWEAVQGRKRLLVLTSGERSGAPDVGELRVTTNACHRANVAIYPVDARGLSVVPDPAGGPGGQLFRGR